MTAFDHFIDLASQRLGGAVLLASDEFFAPKENLLKPTEAVWKAHKYTDRGKWMDGWESRRKRGPGHDWAIVRLGLAGLIRGVVVDTAYFRGNYPQACSIEACAMAGQADPDTLAGDDVEWVEILAKNDLEGDTKNRFELRTDRRFTHLRFNIFPDGGVARLRVHGEPLPDLKKWARLGEIDLGGLQNGGRVVCASDMFFGDANNLLLPDRGRNMGDGWETKRRRGPGHDWVVVELGADGHVDHVEVDTNHFKGNYPDTFSLEGCSAPAAGPSMDPDDYTWQPLIEQAKLQAHTRHFFEVDISEAISHVRLNIFPDGGVSRLRLRGHASQQGWTGRKMQWLNTLPKTSAIDTFEACCTSTAWAQKMAQHRPYDGLDALLDRAESVWDALGDDDYLEAFSGHPKIGQNESDTADKAASDDPTSTAWSKQEQSGAADAPADVQQRLHDANLAYQQRFGFIFIVYATGKSAAQMLDLLEARIDNDRNTEIANAAAEQLEILRLRLRKLICDRPSQG